MEEIPERRIQFHPLLPQWRRCQKGTREASSSIHYRHNGGDARNLRHTWAGQIMVSLDILCVSIDLRVYILCPVIIQFHPLPPQWRRCQKGTREASSSIHYHHNGGDARKAHVGQSNYGESRYFVCFHRSQSILLMSCTVSSSSIHYCHNGGDARKAHVKHPVPSITATMEEMPERHTWAGQIMVSLDILCASIDLRVYFLCPVIIQFHPLLPQWRKGTREASSSIHYRHNGGDARKAHVKHPVPSITATMEEMPERHT